jgi:hypothetical protein
MNEMELLTRLRDKVPANVTPVRAESALLAAIQAEEAPATAARGSLRARGRAALGLAWAAQDTGAVGRHSTRHTWRLALAGVVSVALAGVVSAALAGVFSAQPIHSGSSRQGAGISVQELAYRTAAAAAAQPEVRPGQWVYWKEAQAGVTGARTFQVWTTADSRQAAYVYHGKIHVFRWHGHDQSSDQYIGQPDVIVEPPVGGGGQGVVRVTVGLASDLPVSYADLGSLPPSPLALARYLGSLPLPGYDSAADRGFEVIKGMLMTYVMPPRLTAELYRALSYLPGVTVDNHAVDVAGQHGIGFKIYLGRYVGIDEIVVDPHTYYFMGQGITAIGNAGSSAQRSGAAILREAFVSGPGVRP